MYEDYCLVAGSTFLLNNADIVAEKNRQTAALPPGKQNGKDREKYHVTVAPKRVVGNDHSHQVVEVRLATS